MAKAETKTPAKPDVILTLTWEEASMLKRLIGGHIGGKGVHRDMTDGIYVALKAHIDDDDVLDTDPERRYVYLR